MKIGIFYFSATGITELIAKHITAVLEKENHSVQSKNFLTPHNRLNTIDFLEYDFIFFGFPVFGGRPPSIAEDWMTNIDGKNKKCSMFFTYGARDLEWAHQITYYLLTQSNFQIVLSAEFIGRHSFNLAGWSLAEDRPNKEDLAVATKFALDSLSRFQNNSQFEIDLSHFSYKPKIQKIIRGEWAKFYPFRESEECSLCNLCENQCPTGAFSAKTGTVNKQLCIHCMHCLSICPDKVIKTGDVSAIFSQFRRRLGLTKDFVDHKVSKILTSYPN
jgi:flavodoxin/Pyruvate/2-oxoacid:ferredoxin oxidoreductase delta subunit